LKSLYDILEISPVASNEVVTAAYRALSKKYHPDKNPGSDAATEAMTAINQAYAVLSDPAQRMAYDAALPHHHRRHTAETTQPKPAAAPAPQSEVVQPVVPPVSKRSSNTPSRGTGIWATAVIVIAVAASIYVSTSFEPDSMHSISFIDHPDPYQARLRKAEALLNGEGVARNLAQAKSEFEAIADNRSVFDAKGFRGVASQKLAEIYNNGLGVPKDTIKAEEWFRKAAESGRVVGPAPAVAVAAFLEEGTNGTTDIVEAYRWYNLAAGIAYNAQTTMISLDQHNQMVEFAKEKKTVLETTLSSDQLRRAQQSPLPPCKHLGC